LKMLWLVLDWHGSGHKTSHLAKFGHQKPITEKSIPEM
jgi:hypothetical protein